MFGFDFGAGSDCQAVLEALSRSLAIIEFDPSGKILTANENFCNALGYSLSEIKGQHHSMFVEQDYARSPDYKAFWAKLGRGEFDAREYRRIGKGGREVWIQASYNPVTNSKGVVLKVVKAARRSPLKNSKPRNSKAGSTRSPACRRSSNSRPPAKSSPPMRISWARSATVSKKSRGGIIAFLSSRPMRNQPNTGISGGN